MLYNLIPEEEKNCEDLLEFEDATRCEMITLSGQEALYAPWKEKIK